MSGQGADGTPGSAAGFVRGAVYLGVANWSSYAVNFVIALLVARILGPEVFGLYAFVVAVNEFVNIVNGLAVSNALVQAREDSPGLYDTGYAVSFGQALVGLLVSLGVAPVLASQRSTEAAVFLLLLALARFPLLLADSVTAQLDRQVRYGAVSVIQLASRSLPNFACLGLAWAGWGAWSLILRDLLLASIPFLLGHLWTGYWFRGRLSREALGRIMAFSGPMFVSRTLEVFLMRFDRLVVGSLLGNTALGLYHQARFIADAGVLAMTPVAQVTFNLYARLQDQRERLARAFSLVSYVLARAFFAAATVLVVAPEETLQLLLGEEWVPVAPVLRILGVYAGIVPLLQNLQVLFFARGRIFTNVRLRVVQAAVFLPGVLLAGWLRSVEGVAGSFLLASFVNLVLGWHLNRDVVRGHGRRVFAVPAGAFLATVAAFPLLADAAGPPGWLVPFLPPCLYGALVVLVERRRLLEEMRFLRAQFEVRAAAPVSPGGG